jgi:multidrug resistance efflux pump
MSGSTRAQLGHRLRSAMTTMPTPTRTRHNRSAVAAILAAMMLVTACDPPGNAKSVGKLHVVRNETIEVTFDEAAIVEASREVSIQSSTWGKLLYIADSGTMLKPGDTVAIIESENTIKSLEQEISNLESYKKDYEKSIESLSMDIRSSALEVDTAMGQLDFQRLRLEDVNRELSRLQVLRDSEVVTEDQVRDARSKSASAQLNAQSQDSAFSGQKTGAALSESRTLKSIERTLLQTQRSSEEVAKRIEELNSSTITAPEGGVFQRRSDWNWQRRQRAELQPGGEVNRGQVLGTLPDVTRPVLKTQIAESQFQRIPLGAEISVVFDSIGNDRFPGTVSKIGIVAVEREMTAAGSLLASQTFSGERVFEVEVQLSREDERIRPGITGKVRFVTDRLTDVASIPVASVWTRGPDHFVALKSGKGWEERPVELGLSTGQVVQVIGGLKPGDSILASDPRTVLNGNTPGS